MTPSSRALSITVAVALFMENMDASVIATSLPAIAADLGTNPISLKLAFTTYLLGLTVFLPVSGWLADKLGAKLVFRVAVVLFTVASMMCGYAHSLEWLVLARGLQGLGGALMVPVGRIILMRSVPKSELVEALTWVTLPALVGPFVGPLVGGFITTFFDWRWIFWMNLPFGILGVVLGTWLMPDINDQTAGEFDYMGFILSAFGLSFTVFGLTVAGRGLMDDTVVSAMVGAGVLLVIAYIFYAQRAIAPIMDLKLLSIQSYRAGVYGGSLYRIGVGATPFLLPLMLQLGFGLSPFQSGAITCVSVLGSMAMKVTASATIKRFGFRALLSVNCVISSLLMLLNCLFTTSTPVLLIMAVLLIAGFFRSLQFTAMNALSFADIETDAMGRATSLYMVAQQLSLAAGVASAAFALDIAMWWRGDAVLVAGDFAFAFFAVTIVSLLSGLQFYWLPDHAGANVSGRVHKG